MVHDWAREIYCGLIFGILSRLENWVQKFIKNGPEIFTSFAKNIIIIVSILYIKLGILKIRPKDRKLYKKSENILELRVKNQESRAILASVSRNRQIKPESRL